MIASAGRGITLVAKIHMEQSVKTCKRPRKSMKNITFLISMLDEDDYVPMDVPTIASSKDGLV